MRRSLSLVIIKSILIMSIVVPFVGCGGGGGGGGAGSTTYSGLKTQTNIDQENARYILENAYSGGILGSSMIFPISAIDVGELQRNEPHSSRNLALLILGLSKKFTGYEGTQIPSTASAVQTESINESGDCGGKVTGRIQVDDSTGSMSGNLTFDNYNDCELVLNGAVSFSGQIDILSENLSMTMTYRNLSVVMSEEIDAIMSGTIYYAEDTDMSSTWIMDYYLRDNISGDSFLFEDYTETTVRFYKVSQVVVSGRFYCSDYGYVDLFTEEALVILDDEEYPSYGRIRAEGDNNSMAWLEFFNANSYIVYVDEDGDGFLDYNSVALYWDN